MSRGGRLLFPVTILALLALAAFGIHQVVSRGGAEEPPGEPASAEEASQRHSKENARALEAIQRFADSGSDPCSLPSGGIDTGAVEWDRPYLDLASLINDADLVVAGHPVGRTLGQPSEDTAGAPILVTVEIDGVLKGLAATSQVTADLAGRVSGGPEELHAIFNIDLDSCSDDQLLLFLNQTADAGVFQVVGYQGWVDIEGDAIRPGELNHLLDDRSSAQALLESVRQVAQDQESQGVPKGRLRCEAMRPSADYLDPPACPGDPLNPYEAFGLGAIAEASVVSTDPGPSGRSLGQTDLSPDDPRLLALIQALKLDVTLEPFEVKPQDLIYFQATPKDLAPDALVPSFAYSPSMHIVQLSVMGQFDAPPAFEEAMKPFVTAASAQ
jgi:hypothetical protein